MKDLLMSKTFWGALVTALGVALAHFGVDINVSATSSALVSLIGLAYTIVGRVQTNEHIGSIAGIPLKRKRTMAQPEVKSP